MNALEKDLNDRIASQESTITNLHNLVHSIYDVCNHSTGNNKVKKFQNWKLSNNRDISQDKKEYSFSGRQGDEISFSYRVDSEQGYDKFIVYLISPSDTIKLIENSGRSKKVS